MNGHLGVESMFGKRANLTDSALEFEGGFGFRLQRRGGMALWM